MAIKDDSQNTTSAQKPTVAGYETTSGNQAQPQGGQRGQRWSFMQGGLFAAPIERGLGSEYLGKLVTALEETYKSARSNADIAVISLDNANEPALAFSCVVVCMRNKQDPAAGTAYHVLLVEATGEKPGPVFENINGQQIEIMRVTGSALDDILLKKVAEKVRSVFPQGPLFMVDGSVVPKSFNPEDKMHVHILALNAGLACGTELEINSKDFHDLNLAEVGTENNLAINVMIAKQQLEDAVGEPMRSDVLVSFSAQQQQTGKVTSLNAGDRTAKISEVSGFIDLLWAPVAAGPGFNPYAPVQPAATQKYAARLVMTNLASEMAYTPASILLSMVTSLSLRDDNNWIQAFRPSANGGDVDLNDIGALNIEGKLDMLNDPANYGNPNVFSTRMDTKADSFRLEDLGRFVAALVQPGLIVSMDVPEVGPQTWYTSVFAAASSGSSQAYDVIIKAAMDLTNGNFAKYFPQNSPIFVDTNNRVHLGSYLDKNGVRRDIRDIDYLAVANMADVMRNHKLIRDWSDTFTQVQYPLAMRLAARKKIIQGLTRESAEFTGFAQRVTFTAHFLDAVARGARDAGLMVRVSTPLSSSEFTAERGVAGFVGGALMAPGQSFYAPVMGQPGFNQQMMGGQFRW